MERKNNEITRRQYIVGLLYELWTNGGSDLSALAPVIFDGRIDLIGEYVTVGCSHDNNEESEKETSETTTTTTRSNTSTTSSIDRVHFQDLPPDEFVAKYMRPNIPVMIQGLTQTWKSQEKWVRRTKKKQRQEEEEVELEPNIDYLWEHFGNDTVQVHEQKSMGFPSSYARPTKTEMTFSEYANWWNDYHNDDNNDNQEEPELPLLYLKDWKVLVNHPRYNAYEWPVYFRDDWLNGTMGNAYKFVYLGPKGSTTALHADVLRSFSWSTNLCGRKRWYLVPPRHTYLLYDCFGKQKATHLHAHPSLLFPGLKVLHDKNYAIEIIQERGETIFVPSNWYHTVENLEATLSINHNWLNGSNIRYSWDTIRSEISFLLQQRRQQHAINSKDTENHDNNENTIITTTNNNISSNNNNADNSDTSQVEDDLVTLVLILSKKANELMRNSSSSSESEYEELVNIAAKNKTTAGDKMNSSKTAAEQNDDLATILCILEMIEKEIYCDNNGADNPFQVSLEQKSGCDVHDLIRAIQRHLGCDCVTLQRATF